MPTQEQVPGQEDYIVHAREVFVRISMIALMGVTCYLILRPFLLLIAWGIILAIATYPVFRWISRALGGRERLAAGICTALLLMLVMIPAILMADMLSGTVQSFAVRLQSGNIGIPDPPATLERWPVIGAHLKNLWGLASANVAEVVSKLGPQIRAHIPAVLSASADIGATLLQFVLSILLAGYLLASSQVSGRSARSIFTRLFGDRALEMEELTQQTVRSVTNGILGVAVIQSVLAGAAFFVVGLPGAALWTTIFLVASVLQIGGLVLIPAAIYAFTITSTTHAGIFLAFCVVVGLMDNVLKPLLLGRGSKVPTAVIFVGVIGGFVAMGIVGLFVGAIVLSVGYKLFLAWLNEDQYATPGARIETRRPRTNAVARSA